MRSLNFNDLARRASVLGVVLALVAGSAALAQIPTGNLHVVVVDSEGAALPGVTVTLSGIGAPRLFVTGADGKVRFLGIDPGNLQLKAELEGFSTVEYPNVEIRSQKNVNVEITMSSAIEEVITVTSESPLLDERRLSAGTTVTQVELDKIPTSRDPWSLMTQTPGVVTDRVNVAGSESGQQAVFMGPGASSDENDWTVDGIQITDMAAIGASPTYYDFDQFAEVTFTTGGTDVTKNTAGVAVNMVTKRGTNEFRGSARFFVVQAKGYFNGALSESALDVSSELCATGCPTAQTPASYSGRRMSEVEDFGFEAGGAALKDRVWLWGSWGQNDIKSFAGSGDNDDTILENTSFKINVQLSSANSFVGTYNNGEKLKAGRGAGPTRSSESLWDQRGPSAFYKVEDTHVFSSNFFLTGSYAIVDLGFALIARGDVGTNGLDPAASDPTFTSDGVWNDNFLSGASDRPGTEFKLDGSYFFNTGNTSHELKVGGRFREVEGQSFFSWGPRNVLHAYWGADLARHGANGPSTTEYISFWAQDTMVFGNLTLNVGFRFDDQSGETDAATVAPHAVFPTLLPGFSVPAGLSSLSWESITPRIGVTYALGEERKTLLRGSFAQFAQQQPSPLANWASPTYYGWYAYFYTGTTTLYAASYFDPLNPTVSPNSFSGGFDPAITNELILGVEHAVLPEFVVGANINWRRTEDVNDLRQVVRDGSGGLRPATAADYSLITTLTGTIPRTGTDYSVPLFDLTGQPSVFSSANGAPSGGAMWLTGPREVEAIGYGVDFTKRLANNWMARGYFGYGDGEWDVPAGFMDCPGGPFLANGRGGGCRDGDLSTERVVGSGKTEDFPQATWNYNLNGMYQVAPDRPWGFNLAANIYGREGFPVPYYRRNGGTYGSIYSTVVPAIDFQRLDDITIVDLRIEKEFAVGGPIGLTFGVDLFNATNDQSGNRRQTRDGLSSSGFLTDNISPRIWRIGVRLNWR